MRRFFPLRAGDRRVQVAVRASALPPFDRIANTGFWLQLSLRQNFNQQAPPALLVLMSLKVNRTTRHTHAQSRAYSHYPYVWTSDYPHSA